MFVRKKHFLELISIVENLVEATEKLKSKKLDKEEDESVTVFGSYYGLTSAKERIASLLGKLGIDYEDY